MKLDPFIPSSIKVSTLEFWMTKRHSPGKEEGEKGLFYSSTAVLPRDVALQPFRKNPTEERERERLVATKKKGGGGGWLWVNNFHRPDHPDLSAVHPQYLWKPSVRPFTPPCVRDPTL
jgi:hypothetical protein